MNTVALIIVLLFVFLAVRDFLNQTDDNVEATFTSYIEQLASNQRELVVSRTERLEVETALAAEEIVASGGVNGPNLLACLQQISARGTFRNVGIAYPDGSAVSASGEAYSVSGEGWFKKAREIMRCGIYADATGTGTLTVYAPILVFDRLQGVFFGRYTAERIGNGLTGKVNGYPVITLLMQRDGSFLYPPAGQILFAAENLTTEGGFFTELESAEFLDESTLVGVQSGIADGGSHRFCIRTETQKAYAYYTPLAINGWYLLLTVDHSALTEMSATQGRTAIELLIKVLFAVLLTALIIMFYSWASKQAVLRSAERINAMTNSIPCGVQQFDPVGAMNFRYVSDGFFEMSGYTEEELRSVFSNSFLAVVHPEDRKLVEDLIKSNDDTQAHLELKYRIITKDGRIVWVLNRLTRCTDEVGAPYYQCVCVDITRLKQVEQSLASKAQLDQLTGLYNREAARMFIHEFFEDPLRRYGNHAFFMLDMDGFKRLNDTYGHIEGDRILCRVAGILRSAFRGTDVLCRLAGDEFVVFMKDAESRDIISEKAEIVCRRVEELRTADGMEASVISISIGISLAPQDGDSFETLYKCADEALYAAKRSGKNRFVFYDAMPTVEKAES